MRTFILFYASVFVEFLSHVFQTAGTSAIIYRAYIVVTSAQAKAESGSQGSTENDPKLTKTWIWGEKSMGKSIAIDG